MKKIMTLIIVSLLIAPIFGQSTSEVYNYNKLPKAAKSLLAANFKNDKVVFVEVDKDLASTEYEVKLQSGTEINFNSKGEWKEIESKTAPIPSSMINPNIKNYVDQHYKGMNIVKMDKDFNKIDIELSNGIDLEFDLNGKFIRVDN